ncbi:hypothetical protein ACVOZ6_004720 [Escherichia coli]
MRLRLRQLSGGGSDKPDIRQDAQLWLRTAPVQAQTQPRNKASAIRRLVGDAPALL